MKKIAFLLLLILANKGAFSQADTDIFIFQLMLNDEEIALTDGKNVTKQKGYDNQPSFFNDVELYYTSATKEGQTEIFSVRVDKLKTKQRTKTVESEYSPMLIPNSEHFSVIQVEQDGTQRLWKFPIKGKEKPSVILENVKPVGYHVWNGANHLAMFVLGQPNTLQTANVSVQETKILVENIGRCFKNVPDSELVSFVHKISENNWEVKSLDIKTGEIKSLVPTLEGREDYAWVSGNTLIMGKGSKLFKYSVGIDGEWQEVGDLSMFGIYDFNRLAVSPNKKYLAVVATDFDE